MATFIRKYYQLNQTATGWKGQQAWQVENVRDGFLADQDPDVPRYGQAWDAQHPALTVQDKSITLLLDKHTLIICKYSTDLMIGLPFGLQPDPSLAPNLPIIRKRWDFGTRSCTKYSDNQGHLVNPTGGGYQDLEPYIILEVDVTCTNRQDYDPFFALLATTNSHPFGGSFPGTGLPRGMWRCTAVLPEDINNGLLKVTFRFEYRTNITWEPAGGSILEPINHGWREAWYYKKTKDDGKAGDGLDVPDIGAGSEESEVTAEADFNWIYTLT